MLLPLVTIRNKDKFVHKTTPDSTNFKCIWLIKLEMKDTKQISLKLWVSYGEHLTGVRTYEENDALKFEMN